MPRTYLIFGDIEGKLGVLRVECTKCDRKGRYHVDKLIEKFGRKGNMSKWVSELKGDCPKAVKAWLQAAGCEGARLGEKNVADVAKALAPAPGARTEADADLFRDHAGAGLL
jgi:hypothetical protein